MSTRSVRPLVGYVGSRLGDAGALLAAGGVDAALFQDLESRMPHDQAVSLWAHGARLTGDADIGLHVAEASRPGAFGVLEYVARTSPTLGVGFDRLFRYHRVLHDVAETALERSSAHATLSHRLPMPGGAPRPISDFVLASWLRISRVITGVPWTPVAVRFPHARPADVSEYRRLFGASVTFGCERSELVAPVGVLDLPLLTADAALHPILEAQVSAMDRRLPAGENIVDSIRRVLADDLCDGEPTLEHISTRLHMSARTLHRRLVEQGTTFRSVLGDVRRELAERYLRERQLAIGEIGFLLGFSDASAFHRAFKRWTGLAPLAFRQASAAAR